MRWRKNAVSAALILLTMVLGVYLFAVDRGAITTREAEMRKKNLLPAFRRDDISAITIEKPAGGVRVVRRADSSGDTLYYVASTGAADSATVPAATSAPAEELADQTSVDKLMSALEFATPERRLDKGGLDRHQAGLDAPKLTLTVAMGKLTYRLAIGGPAPAPAGASYGELDGEGVLVVSRDLVTELERSYDSYRTRTLLPYLSPDLDGIALEGLGEARRFVRGAWGGWKVDVPEGPRVDRDAFDRVLTSFADVRAEAFLSKDEAEHALLPEHLRFSMHPKTAGRPRVVLDIGGPCPGHAHNVIAIRREPSPTFACIPEGVMGPLATPVDKLMDRHLFTLRQDEVEEIAIVLGERRLEIARKGTGWHMRAPTEGEVDQEAGADLSRGIHEWSADAIAPAGSPAQSGFGPVERTITVTKAGEHGDEDAKTEVVELGPKERDGSVYARRKEDGVVLKLSRQIAEALVPSPALMRSRKVIDEPLARVRHVAIALGDTRQELARSATGTWTLSEPRGFTVDPALANDVAEAAGGLKADRWAADKDDGTFGLAQPRGTIDLDVGGAAHDEHGNGPTEDPEEPGGEQGKTEAPGKDAGAARSVHIDVGDPTTGGAFAQQRGEGPVFVLAQASLNALSNLAVDRSYFMLDIENTTQVELRAGSKGVNLVRRGDALAAKDGAPPLSIDKLRAMTQGLVEMRAEGVVHLGAERKDEGFGKPQLTITVRRAAVAGVTPADSRVIIGAGDVWRGTNVFYARRAGVDATFAIAAGKVRPILDAM